MLERNVSVNFNWPVNTALRFVNFDSRRKIKSSRNTSFLGISRARSNHREGREDPDKVIRQERAQVVVVEGGEAEVEAVVLVEEAEAEARGPAIGQSRTRTKLRGAITTGSEVTTKRWRGEGRLLCSIMVGMGRRRVCTPLPERYKDREMIIVGELNGHNTGRSGDISRKTYP